MKTCEICGRPIRTGRKYCWEHRHTSQAEAIRGDKLVNKAMKKYWEYFIWKFFLIWIVLFFLIGMVIFSIFHIMDIVVCFTTFFIFAIVFLFIVMWLKFYRKRILSSKKCEEYVKNYLRKHQEERERINRIKDEALYKR